MCATYAIQSSFDFVDTSMHPHGPPKNFNLVRYNSFDEPAEIKIF